MKKFISKPAALIKYMLLAVLAVSFIACGYDDVNEEKAKVAAEYYANDATPRSALIDADTLKGYIDAGYVTPDGKKVLILHVAAQDGTLPATTIKGAYGLASDSYFMEGRSDGPITDSAMVASGAKMDSFLRAYGIDMNTLVVLTAKSLKNGQKADGKDETHAQMLARAFWTFKYWGFSNNNVKVLDGADSYFATLYPELMEAFRYGMPQPSTFSVKDLPGQRMDIYRAPIGEVLGYAATGALKADGTGSAIMVSTMNAATPVNKPGLATPETYVIGNSRFIEGRINGETQLALSWSDDLDANTVGNQPGYNNAWSQYLDTTTGKFKTEAELRALIKGLTTDGTEANSFLPEDKNKRIMFHCITGRTTAPHWFIVKELLGYTNAAIYDGSWSEWTNLAGYVPTSITDTFVNPGATDYLAWNGSEFVKTDGTKASVDYSPAMRNLNWDTARYTKFLTMAPKDNTNTYDNEYAGDGREINTEDKNYQAGKDSSSTGGNSGGASSGGGSAPAGC